MGAPSDNQQRGKRGTAPAPKRPSRAVKQVPEASQSSAASALEEQLGYRFQRPELLDLALTHSSFIYEQRLGRARGHGDEPNAPGTDNEQLEFLGDAVLGLAVTELLLRSFPERSEGELTRMRSVLVSRKRMAALGEQLALGHALRLGRSAENVETRQKMAILANTAEAVLGAVYLDVTRSTEDNLASQGEHALQTVRGLVERLIVAPDLPAIRAELNTTVGRGALRDSKSRLQERVQAENAGRLAYVDTLESGPAHARHFAVEVRLLTPAGGYRRLAKGEGGSKKEAQQAAAGIALAAWEKRRAKASERSA